MTGNREIDGAHFACLATSLDRLKAMDGLDAAQRHVLGQRIASLLDDREDFLAAFRAVCNEPLFAAYLESPEASALDAESRLVEVLHLFAMARLTLVDGAESMEHLRCTAEYLRILATARGDPETFGLNVALAAMAHDVGLAVVPQDIFGHRGQVDSYESLLIEVHTRIGAAMIDVLCAHLGLESGPLALAREIAFAHHERHDGLGPQGLVGEGIPYAARLFALADVYDALRRQRGHRKGLEHAAAVLAVRAGNRQGQARFDSALLPAFVASAAAFEAVFDAFGDKA